MKIKARLTGRAPRTQPGEFRPDRARFVQWGIFGLFGLIAVRAVVLTLVPTQGSALQHIADNQYSREIELAPYRGGIFDRKGDALAISVKRPSLAVNPRLFNPTPDELAHLGRLLNFSQQRLKRYVGRHAYFAWLARQLDQGVADSVMNMGLAGVVQISEPARFYPAGSAAAHLLGFIGLDDGGLAGLERQFDKELRGQAFKVMAEKDARGHVVFQETAGAAPEKSGDSVYLTVDRVVQEIAEDELAVGVRAVSGKAGFVIVSDPHTGRILAVANSPSFDPNNTRGLNPAATRNSALLDTFEPGSVVKPFVIGYAIDHKATTPDEKHFCDKGALRIGKHTIHDDHAAETLTTAETLIRSSNICTYKIAAKMGREATAAALATFGFGGNGGRLGYPAEAIGRVSDWRKWATIRFANVAFGHGFVVTGLELVQAMGAIANGGHLMQPSLVERVLSSDGSVLSTAQTAVLRNTMSPATARTMRSILEQVVINPHGTGKAAFLADYTTAGKTGTAQKVEPGIRGYAKGKFVASFIGFAPVGDPHLVIYVMVDEPDGKHHHGAEAAAPIFAHVAERVLKYLNVAPDKVKAPLAVGHKAGVEGSGQVVR